MIRPSLRVTNLTSASIKFHTIQSRDSNDTKVSGETENSEQNINSIHNNRTKNKKKLAVDRVQNSANTKYNPKSPENMAKIKKPKKNKKKMIDSRQSPLPTSPQVNLVPDWPQDLETIPSVQNNMEESHSKRLPILLVFDLNGTLVHRSASKSIQLRPYTHEFIEFVMKHFYVMTWTTAKPVNSFRIISKSFGPYRPYILCNLTRLHCQLDGDYYQNPDCIKDLSVIWDHSFTLNSDTFFKTLPSPPVHNDFQDIYQGEIDQIEDDRVKETYLGSEESSNPDSESFELTFSESNTILIDDSPNKAKNQPDNYIEIPTYKGAKFNDEDRGLLDLQNYLTELMDYYNEQTKICESLGLKFQFSVVDYMIRTPFKP